MPGARFPLGFTNNAEWRLVLREICPCRNVLTVVAREQDERIRRIDTQS